MNRILRWIAYLVLVLVLGWATLFFYFDPDKYREEFETLTSEMTGRTITVGDLDWGASYRPTLVVSDVRMGNTEWANHPVLLSAEKIVARLALAPLLRGQFDIRQLTVKHAEVHLEQKENGEANWHAQPGSSGSALPVQAIQLRDTKIWVKKGEDEPYLFDVQKLHAKTGQGAPLSIKGTVSYLDTPYKISAGMGITDAGDDGLVTPIQLQAKSSGGTLTANGTMTNPGGWDVDLSLTLPAGKISGNITMDTQQAKPVVRSRFSTRQLAYGQLLKDSGVTDKVDGLADIDIVLNGTGIDLDEVLANANGSANFTSGKGSLAIAKLNWWGAGLLTSMLPMNWKHGDTTQLNCVVGRFDIEQGVASSKTIIIDTDRITIAGELSLNLATEALEGVFTPEPKDPALFRVAETMNLSGTLRNPVRKVAKDSRLKTAGGLLFSMTNPAAMMLTFSSMGSRVENPCTAAADQHEETAPSTTSASPASPSPSKRPGKGTGEY